MLARNRDPAASFLSAVYPDAAILGGAIGKSGD
jgi:hypothetical protein